MHATVLDGAGDFCVEDVPDALVTVTHVAIGLWAVFTPYFQRLFVLKE